MCKILKDIIKIGVKQEVSDIYIKEDGYVSYKDIKGMILSSILITKDDFKDILNFLIIKDNDKDRLNLCIKNKTRFLFGVFIEGPFIDSENREYNKIRVRGQITQSDGIKYLVLRIFLNKNKNYKELTQYSGIGILLDNIFKIKQGLIIIIGGTGQGKSTLVSAYLEKIINEGTAKNLVTIEDPKEYIFEQNVINTGKTFVRGTYITQYEIGTDFNTYEEAILSTTRDNSDIVYIQEIASKESAIALKKILNSGKLVIITLHSPKVTQTITRLLELMGETSGSEMSNRRLLAQESICIIGQNLINGYVINEKGERIKNSNGEFLTKKYGVQEFLNIGPVERNYITDNTEGFDFEKMLTKSLNDPSKKNIPLNNILLSFYKKGIIDAETVFIKSNDLNSLKEQISEMKSLSNNSKEFIDIEKYFK